MEGVYAASTSVLVPGTPQYIWGESEKKKEKQGEWRKEERQVEGRTKENKRKEDKLGEGRKQKGKGIGEKKKDES